MNIISILISDNIEFNLDSRLLYRVLIIIAVLVVAEVISKILSHKRVVNLEKKIKRKKGLYALTVFLNLLKCKSAKTFYPSFFISLFILIIIKSFNIHYNGADVAAIFGILAYIIVFILIIIPISKNSVSMNLNIWC